ncbi:MULTISPECIES: chromosome condensation regulator RCC1 [unclassified Streptomyces]|uniref:RCC1 domain-containing protein n=1 Tax=unclassified Streptomyces TaxID=2593676 RepID=UPI0006F4E233|nr:MULTISPECIES: chromosome condensation regulator RCC1 [unclassified Streptomyces]KQX56139.1 chromosome condensation regulator RCC1 [Streptomyces sp. Root1304]KRA96955.1 chromosome condensation regulator RCC1 [Streptomyces sp. Root66D1]
MRYAYVRRTALLALAVLALSAGPARAEPHDPWARAWGTNAGGQLGNGSVLDQLTPSAVKGLARNDLRELTSGGWVKEQVFALALLRDGTVQSWGGNGNGQLGDGTTAGRPSPAAVAGLSGVSGIAAGLDFALALRGGRMLSWGNDAYGQLGDGLPDPSTATTRPVAVQSLNKVKEVTAGCYHGVALREDGTVWTWGRNADGQLGIGSTTDQSTPKKVPGLVDAVAVAAGCYHTLALTADGTVKSWGRGNSGQLGDDGVDSSPSPVDVKHLDGVARIYSGGHHNFAVLDDGSVRAWGWNAAGQLGDGTTVTRTTPVPVPGASGVRALSCGYRHTLAVLDDGSVLAWGDNDTGQLGDGTTTPSLTPVVSLPPGSGTTRVSASTVSKSSYAY